MKVTLILSLVLMAALFLMLWAAVAFVQSKRFFGTAPKDIQKQILEHEERFPGQRILGWILLVAAVAAYPAVFLYGGGTAFKRATDSGSFLRDFLSYCMLIKHMIWSALTFYC